MAKLTVRGHAVVRRERAGQWEYVIDRTQRQAEALAVALNAYAASHDPRDANPWEDVIRAEPWDSCTDEEATDAADRSGMSDTVILRSGWAVVWDEPAGEWQVREPGTVGGGGA